MPTVWWKHNQYTVNHNRKIVIMSVSVKFMFESEWIFSFQNKIRLFLKTDICFYVGHSFVWSKIELIILVYLLSVDCRIKSSCVKTSDESDFWWIFIKYYLKYWNVTKSHDTWVQRSSYLCCLINYLLILKLHVKIPTCINK